MSDTPILIVATFAAATGKGNALYEVLNRCVAPSRLEEGNVHYDLYRSVENSDLFLFHETWKSAAAIELHETQPHFKALLAGVDGLLAEPPVITKI